MKKRLVTSLLALMSLPGFSQGTSVRTESRPFSARECAVTYENSYKTMSFKIIKKARATEWQQALPRGAESVACSGGLKAALKLTAENCQVFCNLN